MIKKLISVCLFLIFSSVWSQTINSKWTSSQHAKKPQTTEAIGVYHNTAYFLHSYKVSGIREQRIVKANFNIDKVTHTYFGPEEVFYKHDEQTDCIALLSDSNRVFGISKSLVFRNKVYFSINEISIAKEGTSRAKTLNQKEFYEYPWATNLNLGKTKIAKSNDYSKTLLFVIHPTVKKSPTSTLGLCIFNGSKIQESKTIQLNVPSKKLNIYDVTIDDYGNVLISVNYKKNKKRITEYYFVAKDKETTVLFNKNISESIQLVEFKMRYNPVYGSMIYGTYNDRSLINEKASRRIVNGLFSMRIENGNLSDIKLSVFSDSLVFDYHKARENPPQYAGIYYPRLKKIHFQSNGDPIFLLEDVKTTSEKINTTPKAGIPNYIERFTITCQDVIILALDQQKNAIKWHHTLRKYQKMVKSNANTAELSFLSTVSNDKLLILYNRHKYIGKTEWLNEDGTKVFRKREDNQIAPVFRLIIDANGNVLSKNKNFGDYIPNLYKNFEVDMFLHSDPYIIDQNNNLWIIAYTRSQSKYSLGKISLTD